MTGIPFDGPFGLDGGIMTAILIILVAGVTLGISQTWRLPARSQPARSKDRRAAQDDDRAVFLIEGDDLIDTSSRAEALLRQLGNNRKSQDKPIVTLESILPGLKAALTANRNNGRLFLTPGTPVGSDAFELPHEIALAEIEHFDGRTRLTIIDNDSTAPPHPLAIKAMQHELDLLRLANAGSRELVWTEDAEGDIVWANTAYLETADEMEIATTGVQGDISPPKWPPRKLFAPIDTTQTINTAKIVQRVSAVTTYGQKPASYDIRVAQNGHLTMYFATDASRLVAAEEQGRVFMQTLTKTFAQLSIGLAIFDRDRRLSTFNPALLDLTGLGAPFLTARPMLGAVLDRLRDTGILQEPRNYRSWKDGLTDVIKAARDGTYCETWTLPSGRVYRVTGRPHPDGAIAFLFEDISAEVSLTRNFRAEIETAQAVIDTLDEAVAVFSPAGTLTTHNAAFESRWAPEPTTGSLDALSIGKICDHLKTLAAPTPLWAELRRFVKSQDGRRAFTTSLRLTDGRMVLCRVVPMPGGATMVGLIHADHSGPSINLEDSTDAGIGASWAQRRNDGAGHAAQRSERDSEETLVAS